MAWPSGTADTTDLDAATDSPAAARADIKDALDKLNLIIGHVTAFAQSLLDDSTAGAARTTLGAVGSGAVTSGELTMSTARVLMRTTAGTGAIEEGTAAALAAFIAAATEGAQGAVELATAAEAQAGTDITRAVTPSALQAAKIIPLTSVTASGTAINFTGIPSWANRVTVALADVSTNGSSSLFVRVGNGSVVTSGYSSNYSVAATSTNAVLSTNSTAGFIVFYGAAPDTVTGTMILTRLTGNTWISTHTFNRAGWSVTGGGYITLGSALDRVQLTSVSGDTFDNGTVNVLYE